jgi:anion-transporting  ArsA/GET3 family ATPase
LRSWAFAVLWAAVATVVHFVSGKGGVGKSTLAAALALKLLRQNEGPVLLFDILGNGHGFALLGNEQVAYRTQASLRYPELFFSRLTPMESFKEYFSLLLSLGKEDAFVAQMTSRFRESLIEVVMENKAIRSFVKACPGLEPIVMLGKIFWEARNGKSPATKEAWAHIVVDCPASGHFLMLFRSALALKNVFASGVIHSQAQKMDRFIHDESMTRIYLASTLEELPLRETSETLAQLAKLNLRAHKIWLNRVPPLNEGIPESTGVLTGSWEELRESEKSLLEEQRQLLKDFESSATSPLVKVPELLPSPAEEMERLVSLL